MFSNSVHLLISFYLEFFLIDVFLLPLTIITKSSILYDGGSPRSVIDYILRVLDV